MICRGITLRGLGELTPAQMSQMSLAALNSHLLSLLDSIAYIERELNNPNIEESTKVGMRANKVYYESIVNAIRGWLALTPTQRATTNGSTYIRNQMSQYQQSQQQQNYNQNLNPGGFMDTLTQNYAGLPLWGWLLVLGAGGYIVYERMSA